MLQVDARQRYQRAAAQAARDARRTIQDTRTFEIGELTLGELRGLMGLSITDLSKELAAQTGITWSRAQLSRIENGSRNMTDTLYTAMLELIHLRKGTRCQPRERMSDI